MKYDFRKLETGEAVSYFPMFVQLQDVSCLIVGGGQVALRKVQVMLDFGACITVVAPKVCEELSELAKIQKTKSVNKIETEKLFKNKIEAEKSPKNEIADTYNDSTSLYDESDKSKETNSRRENGFASENEFLIRIINEEFKDEDLSGMEIVIAATDSRELNDRIAQLCKERHIPVNAVDQPEDCSFIVPAYLKQGEVVAAFSSGGKAPTITQYLKEKTKPFVTEELAELNDYLGEIRPWVKDAVPTEVKRKEIYSEIMEQFFKNGCRLTEEEFSLVLKRHK